MQFINTKIDKSLVFWSGLVFGNAGASLGQQFSNSCDLLMYFLGPW